MNIKQNTMILDDFRVMFDDACRVKSIAIIFYFQL